MSGNPCDHIPGYSGVMTVGYKDLNAAHLLKELLPDVFKADSKSESEKLWDKCFEIAMSSDVKEITSFAANQNRRYRDEITN